jgi:hypothetical protein
MSRSGRSGSKNIVEGWKRSQHFHNIKLELQKSVVLTKPANHGIQLMVTNLCLTDNLLRDQQK